MDRDQAIELLREHADEIRARGVINLALFGSLARDEGGPGSDIDIVVDLEPGISFSLVDHASLYGLLRDLLGQDVDVVIREDLRPDFRKAISGQDLRVF